MNTELIILMKLNNTVDRLSRLIDDIESHGIVDKENLLAVLYIAQQDIGNIKFEVDKNEF